MMDEKTPYENIVTAQILLKRVRGHLRAAGARRALKSVLEAIDSVRSSKRRAKQRAGIP